MNLFPEKIQSFQDRPSMKKGDGTTPLPYTLTILKDLESIINLLLIEILVYAIDPWIFKILWCTAIPATLVQQIKYSLIDKGRDQ